MKRNPQFGFTQSLVALVTLIFLFAGPAFSQGKSVIDTNICAITLHPSRFQNRIVQIRGTADGGMEANILIDTKDGKWNRQCGRINLDFHSIGTDEITSEFLRLFNEQPSTDCNNDDEAKQTMAHLADPNVPLPMHCFPTVCIGCRRYSIIATFTGVLRHRSSKQGGFGHLGMFDLQLDVHRVANLEVTDTLAPATH